MVSILWIRTPKKRRFSKKLHQAKYLFVKKSFDLNKNCSEVQSLNTIYETTIVRKCKQPGWKSVMRMCTLFANLSLQLNFHPGAYPFAILCDIFNGISVFSKSIWPIVTIFQSASALLTKAELEERRNGWPKVENFTFFASFYIFIGRKGYMHKHIHTQWIFAWISFHFCNWNLIAFV